MGEKDKERADSEEEEELVEIEEEHFFLEDLEEEDVLDELPPEPTRDHPPPDPACVTTPPLKWSSQHTASDLSSHFNCGEDFVIKNISALFSHTANETVAKLMSFQGPAIASITKEAPTSFLRILGVVKRLSRYQLGSFVNGVWNWGVANAMKDYAHAKGEKGATKTITSQGLAGMGLDGSELKRVLSINYVTAETIMYLLSNNPLFLSLHSSIAFSEEDLDGPGGWKGSGGADEETIPSSLIKNIEEFAMSFHTMAPLSHSKVSPEMVLDSRVRYLWAHMIGKLAERGRLDQIYQQFSQTVVSNPKDHGHLFSGLLRSVSFLEFPGSRGITLFGQVCDEVVTNFKPLVGKSSKQRDSLFSVLLGWFTSVLKADDEGLTANLDKSVSVLLERVMKFYKKGKFLEGTMALASLTCLRLRLLKSDDKLKASLTPYVTQLISAVKSNASRSYALEGIFRILVSGALPVEDMKSLIWAPLINYLVPNRDKISPHAPSLNVLVDVFTVMLSQDPNAAITDLLLPLLEPPFAPEIFMAAACAFLRLWEMLPDGEQIRHMGVLKAWDEVSVALGVVGFPHQEDLDYLAIQRKGIVDEILKKTLHVTNLVLHIGKLNRCLCNLFESHGHVINHITTNTAMGKAPDALAINTMVVMLMCSRITIPVHIPRQQWLSSMCKMTQHTNAHLRSCAVKALQDVIRHYPDLRITLLKALVSFIVEVSVGKVEGLVSLLSLASSLVRLWTAEVENDNHNERKPSLAGELNVEREIELTSEEFDSPLLPLLCHWDTRVRKAVLTVFRSYVSLSDSLNREAERMRDEGEESDAEEEWIREVLDENEDDFMVNAMVNRTIPSATSNFVARTIEDCAEDQEDKWLWTRVVGEIFSCLARRADTTIEEAVRPLHKLLHSLFPAHEKPRVASNEEVQRMKMWGALLSALTASAGCLGKEEGEGEGGESSAEKLTVRKILDTLWLCLFSDRREIRVASEFAFTFLPKESFMAVVDDMEEFQDSSSSLLLKITGKKTVPPQSQAYAVTYLWRILSHNMRGKKVFFSTAFKEMRLKALKHLTTYSSCSSLVIPNTDDPRMALRIRFNTCCWVKNMSEEILDISKNALIQFDTLKIFGPPLHESCFRYLLDTSFAGANRKDITDADNAALSTFLMKKKGLSEEELHKDYTNYKEAAVVKALETLSSLLKFEENMPDNYVFPFVDFLGTLFSQDNENHLKLVKEPTSYFLLPVPPSDLEKIACGCLERAYDEDIPTAGGHMAFLSRVLELRKGDVKFPLPIAIHAILFKLGQESAVLRKQAIGLMRTMAGSEHLKRYYIAAWECMSPLVYRRLQSGLSQEFAEDYKEHTLAVWTEAYSRLAKALPSDRRHILRLMAPWLANFEFDRMMAKDSTKVMDDLIVLSYKFSEIFPQEIDRFWEVIAKWRESNVKILVNHMLGIAARDRNTDMYNVCLYGWSHLIRLCSPHVIRPLFAAASDIDLAVDMGDKNRDWDYTFNESKKKSQQAQAQQNEAKKKEKEEEEEDAARRPSTVRAMARFDSTTRQKARQQQQEAPKKEEKEEKAAEVWTLKDNLPFQAINNPLSLSDIACCSFADLLLENPSSLHSSTPFLFVISVLGMDHPNRFVWENSNRLMANLIQSVTLPLRPNDEEVLKMIRQLNSAKKGLWERQRPGREEMKMTSVNRLRECVRRVVVVLESEWKGEGGENLRKQIASEAMGFAQKLHARSPHLAGRSLQIHRTLFSEELENHVQPLLSLWNQNIVERKPKDFAVSFDVMMNLMTFLDLFDDAGALVVQQKNKTKKKKSKKSKKDKKDKKVKKKEQGEAVVGGKKLSDYGEVFWGGVSALLSCEEKEVFIALTLLEKLLHKYGFRPNGSKDERTEAVIKHAPAPSWQPPYEGLCPLVWKALTSSVTKDKGLSLLLELCKIPYFPTLQGDNHILYYITGFGAYITMELLDCYHNSRVHSVKQLSDQMQEAIRALIAVSKEHRPTLATSLSAILALPYCNKEASSTPLPSLNDILEVVRGVARGVAGSFFPEYDGLCFSLLRELINSGPKEVQSGATVLLASLYEATTKDSKEARLVCPSVLACPLSHMHDRADAEDESEGGVGVEEDNQLKDIHVGVDFLVDGVTKAFIRNGGTISFESFQVTPACQALMGDLTSPSYAWSSADFAKFFVSTSMSVSLRSYKENPPSPLSSLSPFSPFSPKPLLPVGSTAPATEKFGIAEGKRNYYAKMPSDATVQGSSFSPPTYFAAAAPVKPSMPRQRSGFGGFGARMSRGDSSLNDAVTNSSSTPLSSSTGPPAVAPLKSAPIAGSFATASPSSARTHSEAKGSPLPPPLTPTGSPQTTTWGSGSFRKPPPPAAPPR